MTKRKTKIEKRLNDRQNGYAAIADKDREGTRKPGSRNAKKVC